MLAAKKDIGKESVCLLSLFFFFFKCLFVFVIGFLLGALTFLDQPGLELTKLHLPLPPKCRAGLKPWAIHHQAACSHSCWQDLLLCGFGRYSTQPFQDSNIAWRQQLSRILQDSSTRLGLQRHPASQMEHCGVLSFSSMRQQLLELLRPHSVNCLINFLWIYN